MESIARVFMIAGFALLVFGALFWMGARLGLGRLPGDVVVERENFRIAFPLVTSIVLSIILTVVLNIALRLTR
jgi:hypothetical protein